MLAAVRGGGVKPDVAAFLTVLACGPWRRRQTRCRRLPHSACCGPWRRHQPLCGAVFLCGALAMPCQVRPLACPMHAFLGGALDCAPSTPFTDLCLAGTCLPHSTVALRESQWCSSGCVLGLELAPTCASLAWCLRSAAQLLPSFVARSPSHLVLDRGGSLLP